MCFKHHYLYAFKKALVTALNPSKVMAVRASHLTETLQKSQHSELYQYDHYQFNLRDFKISIKLARCCSY